MPATYEPIATTTLSSAASTITFSSIPSTYTDLRLVFVGTTTVASSLFMRFNNDTASNYSFTELYGNGTSAFSQRATSQTTFDLSSQQTVSSTIPAMKTIDIFSYSGSTNKTVLSVDFEDRNGSGYTINRVMLWRSTSAINRIDLYVTSNNLATGTTATLYGIKAA